MPSSRYCAVATISFAIAVSLIAIPAAILRADETSTPPTADDAFAPASDAAYATTVRPALLQHCGECHAPEVDDHVRFLHAEDVAAMNDERSVWRSAVEQLRNRTMPPADQPQPSEAERLQLAEWIERTLEATACDCGEAAAPVTVRRLNRREYRNTILDLTGVDFPVEELFPADGSGGEGFDNNGETLFLGPLLMERYVEAAGRIVDAAIVTTPRTLEFAPADFLLPDDAKPSGGNEAKSLRVEPKREIAIAASSFGDHEYDLAIELSAPEGESTAVLKIDGIAAERFAVEKTDEKSDSKKSVERTARILLPRGDHFLSIRCGGEKPIEVASLTLKERAGEVTVEKQARHRRMLGIEPLEAIDDPKPTARRIVADFARRAFRRPVSDEEIDAYHAVFASAFERGTPFEEAIKLPLRAMLVSPKFLFRLETAPEEGEIRALDDHELAVRLSYYLWSSMPDERLFRLADEGKLHEDATIAAEVDRMLDDPKAARFAEDFVGQWLGTSEVGGRVTPSVDEFREFFTMELLDDMRAEPTRAFADLIERDGSVVDFVVGDWSVVNDRLARHYGLIEDTTKQAESGKQKKDAGSAGEFRRVAFDDGRRGGAMGMAAVHLATSYPNRTSPVLRGAWVLETLLGVRVPAPPPDIPQLKVDKKKQASVRESLARHRESKTCAACHDLIDPLGFALDRFDVLGRWREKDGKDDVDTSASLPSGESFDGLPGLKEILLARREQYVRHLTRKVLGYGLGRSLEDGDDCTVQRIAQRVAEDDDHVRTLIREVALSTPFRNVQSPGELASTPHAAEDSATAGDETAAEKTVGKNPAAERRATEGSGEPTPAPPAEKKETSR